jgi:hypothetical protein
VHDPPIKGSAITTWITSNKHIVPPEPLPRNRFSEPSFVSLGDIKVLVGNGSGGYEERDAEPDDPDVPGKFQIKNVPTGGDYILRIGSDYLITSAGTVDLGLNRGGLPLTLRTELGPDAGFDLSIDGVVPWNDGGGDPSLGDQLEFFSTEANMWRFQIEAAACTRASPTDECIPGPVAPGATQVEGIFNTDFMSGGLEPPQAVRTSEGHRAFVAQLRSQPSANGVSYQSMQKIGELTSLDSSVNGYTSASATLMTDISTGNSISFDWRGGDWAGKVALYGHPDAYNCGFGACAGFVGVLAQAGHEDDGFYNANADLLLMFDNVGETKDTGAMTYGSPAALGGDWGVLVGMRWTTLVDYHLPRTSGLGLNSRGFQSASWDTTPAVLQQMALDGKPLTPPITAPQNVVIDGHDVFAGSQTNLGSELTITWDPPAVIPQIPSKADPNVLENAPVRYTVVVRRMFADPNNNRTRGQGVASFTVFDQTSLTIPPGALPAGETFVFIVRAAAGTTREGADALVREPWRAHLHFAQAQLSSAIFGDAHGDALPIETLASGLNNPIGIAKTATHLYWTEYGDGWNGDQFFNSNGRLFRSELDGQNQVVLFDNLPSPQSIAIDGNALYWTNLGSFTAPDGSLMRIDDITNCEPGSCATTTLVPNSGFSNGNGLLIKNGDIFMAGGGAGVSVIRSNDPCRATGPCTPQAISYEGALSIAADDNNIYWTQWGDLSAGTGRVFATPLDGSVPPDQSVPIANGGSQTWDVHVENGFVFYGNQAWQQPFPSTIDRVPFNNSDPDQHDTIAIGRTNNDGDPSSEAMKIFGTDGTYAYYSGEYRFLMRAKLDGSTGAEQLGHVPDASMCPQGNMLVEGGVMYWADVCTQSIRRFVLP